MYKDVRALGKEFGVEHLIQWFQQFRRGMQYVHERFGVIAEDLKVVEVVEHKNQERRHEIGYMSGPGLDCIAITHGFLADSCATLAKAEPSTNPHISPLQISGVDFPVILGVEEAHHSYFLKTGLGVPIETPGDYYRDPVELAAGVVVREALVYFGIKPV